ncbi:hypothetical protein [Reticulibacter mediterranei]|nr:hypothetical protein [Reticulibacter mediterranei]
MLLYERMRVAMVGTYGDAEELASSANPLYQQVALDYPQVGDASQVYKGAHALIIAFFNRYKQERTIFQRMLLDYEHWRQRDPLTALVIRTEGFPSGLLVAQDRYAIRFGAQAERQMWLMVM